MTAGKAKTPIAALDRLKAKRKPMEVAPVVNPQLSLPLWPDAVRGVPNAVLRGALFGVSQNRATAKKLTLLTAVEGIEIRFKGEHFNQDDLSLWEALLHLARMQPLSTSVEFTANAMLRALGRCTTGRDHAALANAIARLRGGTVEIKWIKDNLSFGGGLISKYYRDEETGRYVVVFDEHLLGMYAQGHSYIDWEQRQALGNNSLAKWLHGFYSSHASPFDYKVETLRSLCGSTVARITEFRRMLRHALGQLEKVGAIRSWEITDDLVQVVNMPSNSQARHLLKRVSKHV